MSGKTNGYLPLSTVQSFDNPFVVGRFAVFCFRRPDERTQANCLNICATFTSYYLHCEVCVISEDGHDMRSLVVTSETRRVLLRRVNYVRPRQGGADFSPWTFVWCRLDDNLRSRMQQCLAGLSGPQSKRFSSWRIFCFYFAGCCMSDTTTCSETTMEVIRSVWGQHAPGIQFHSPDDVYRYVRDNATELNVDETVTPNVPDYFIRRRPTHAAAATRKK